jgi:NAD-dependent dihydropyrimidine dehydrogenase PreA subunit
MAKLRYLSNVVTLRLDREKCTGCGMCLTVCPQAVLAIDEMKARIADLDACMECGACARNCPADAIQVRVGVGCAAAIISGALRGTPPDCGCTHNATCCGPTR